MEDTLRGSKIQKTNKVESLNPCFNGRYSQRDNASDFADYLRVLILVLMEDTLRVVSGIKNKTVLKSLNPCFNGRYSQRKVKWENSNYIKS